MVKKVELSGECGLYVTWTAVDLESSYKTAQRKLGQ